MFTLLLIIFLFVKRKFIKKNKIIPREIFKNIYIKGSFTVFKKNKKLLIKNKSWLKTKNHKNTTCQAGWGEVVDN